MENSHRFGSTGIKSYASISPLAKGVGGLTNSIDNEQLSIKKEGRGIDVRTTRELSPLRAAHSTPNFKNILTSAKKAFKKLYKNKAYTPDQLFKTKEYKQLIDATATLFDSTTITHQISPNTRAYLQQDTLIFSAMKAHVQLSEATTYLLDKDGNITPFHQFEQKVAKLNKTYNQHYLQAEYEYAVQSAQSIAQWENLQDDTTRYHLQYRTAADDKVRQTHAALHNTTLPKNDPFWDKYYPPNGWRCRCVAIEVLAKNNKKSDPQEAIKKAEKATTQITKNGKNKLAMFRFNPGILKVIFPPNNSYTKVAGAEIAKKEAKKKYGKFFESKIILTKPREEQFKQISTNVYEHLLTNKKDDYNELVELSKKLAKNGERTEILPEIIAKEKNIRGIVFPNYKKTLRTNPDLRNGSKYYDLKRPKAIKNILGNANKASKQGCIAIISDSQLDKPLTENIMKERVKDIFESKNYNKNAVIFKIKGELFYFNRTGDK